MLRLLVSCVACACLIAASEVEMAAPLTTQVPLAGDPAGGALLEVDVTVPPDAPGDLGVGAFLVDQHGRWFQQLRPGVLAPGTTTLRFDLGPDAVLVGEPHRVAWTPAAAATMHRGGLLFWSATASRARLVIGAPRWLPAAPPAAQVPALRLIDVGRTDADHRPTVAAGERWQLAFSAAPMPENPYDPEDFLCDLVVRHEGGASARLPAFWDQPMALSDGGDHERAAPVAPGRFCARFRPWLPGRWELRLEAAWAGGARHTIALPDLVVTGTPRDEVVRRDASDPRFLSIGARAGTPRFHWPIGMNLRSVNDLRGQERLGSRLTVDRHTQSYEAYLARLAAGGGDTVEIWLAAWNLALEWRADWPGYHGAGRYNEINAARLDRVLDLAWQHGIRVNLVINNHGQGSEKSDTEWNHHPYRRGRGGWLDAAIDVFSDARALAYQERLRRYLAGRVADHPAVLAWKLWSEVNLTSGGRRDREAVRRWHADAAARWRALDAYGHPVTSHWSGDYRIVDREIAALNDLELVCIDAYHRRDEGDGVNALPELLRRSLHDEVVGRGLGDLMKPLLVTEYGGSWDGADQAQIAAELASAGFAGLVSGHAGAPMLWWYEWVDQGNRYGTFGALRRFLAGEDLRGERMRSALLRAEGGPGPLWCCVWGRFGIAYGYVADRNWTAWGQSAGTYAQTTITIGSRIPAGTMTVEWWDADTGSIVGTDTSTHPGGLLVLRPPPFTRHLAFKLRRTGDPGPAAEAPVTPLTPQAPPQTPVPSSGPTRSL